MKTSLTHLSENKQYEIRRIVDIIQEVVSPEKIILFGSHAKGTQVEHRYQTKDGIIHEYISDYDFLVVTQDNPEKTYVQESKIMDRVDHFNPPVNLEIHEIDYINEGLAWGQYFFADIVKEGILLFDSGKVNFVETRVLTVSEERKKASDYFDIWYPESQGFLKVATFCLSEGDLRNRKSSHPKGSGSPHVPGLPHAPCSSLLTNRDNHPLISCEWHRSIIGRFKNKMYSLSWCSIRRYNHRG